MGPRERPPLLLAIGDVHLGRRPSRLPVESLRAEGVEPRALGPAAAFAAACELALERDVDAVLLAGDVVENDAEFLEAYPTLLASARRLLAARIALLAVVGNHDTRVLPRLADDVPGVQLVGRSGQWESAIVRRDGEARCRVVGWSFPTARFESSPFATWPRGWYARRFDDGAPDALPTLGLLHCDLDASGGHHAPVRRAEIERTGFAFALGHVHKPSSLDGARPAGYLGSLSALDPGEPGPHGPWVFEARADGWRAEHVVLAPLRYDAVHVDVDGAADADELESRTAAGLARHADALADAHDPARAVGVRLVFRGERAVDAAVLAQLGADLVARGARPHAGRLVFVEASVDATRRPLDLAAIARTDDPPGLLARRLLALERGGAERDALLARARPALLERMERLDPRIARPPLDDDDALAALLAREGRLALEELLGQHGGAR